MSASLQLKDFDAQDWEAFAGAEEPAPGVSPKIAYIGDRVVVIDANGASITRVDDDGQVFQANIYFSFEQCCQLAAECTPAFWELYPLEAI